MLNKIIGKILLPIKLIDNTMAIIFIYLIKFYQKTLSPDHGPLKKFYSTGTCKYYPTCSMYGIDVLKKKGFFIGLPRLLWRILRCNPWSKGGVDEA